MDKLKEVFIKLGYSEKDFDNIISSHALQRISLEKIKTKVITNYDFLILLGYSKEEIIKITRNLPAIYSYDIENMQSKIEALQEVGYSKKEIIKTIKDFPAIIGYSIENIQSKIQFMQEEFGYSKQEMIKIAKNCPSIYGFTPETIKNKVEDIKNLGYDKEEVIEMTKKFPSIYNCNYKNMQTRIDDIQKLGYTKEEVLKITKSLPSTFCYTLENIQEKIKFYDSIGLHSLAVIAPKELMQSTKLSYARYMFYKEKGINIDEKNYRKLFIGQKDFDIRYGLSKTEILEKYPYQNGKVSNTINPVSAVNALIRKEGVLEEISKVDAMEKAEKHIDKNPLEGDARDDK